MGNNREPISILNLAKKIKSYQIKKLRLRKLILEKAIDQKIEKYSRGILICQKLKNIPVIFQK